MQRHAPVWEDPIAALRISAVQTLGEQPVVALGTPLPRRALGLVALVGAALGVLALVLPPAWRPWRSSGCSGWYQGP